MHRAASPARQAAWDLVARDLPPTLDYDSNTAFIVGNKLFYQGSGNIGSSGPCRALKAPRDGCMKPGGSREVLPGAPDGERAAPRPGASLGRPRQRPCI